MNPNICRFAVGQFDCAIINDGTFPYPHPAQILFDNAPQDHLAQSLKAHGVDADGWTEWVSSYPTLLVNTGEQQILIDTGAGDLAPTTGHLIPHLRDLDIAPEDINIVIFTHGHPDHIGGALNADGKPAFPNARYVMSKDEWAFWKTDPDLSSLKIDPHLIEVIRGAARAKLPPLQDRLELVEDGDEIAPGIQAVAAPGHTPGHMALAIRSAGEQLLCGVDTVLHPVHVEQPDWVAVFDYAPHETVVTRRKLLGQAAVDEALVHVVHFPFPGLGHIVLQEAGWRWRPLVPTHSPGNSFHNKGETV